MAAKRFVLGGLDNRHDPQAVGADGLVICANVDHKDDKSVSRRKGFTPTAITGVALHSLWGSRDQSFGFVVDGTSLYRLSTDLTPSFVGDLPGGAASFIETDDLVIAVTPDGVRFIAGTGFATLVLPPKLDGEKEFKALTEIWRGDGGVYFNNRLYVISVDLVLFSTPGNVGVYDKRDYILPVGFVANKIFAVSDGMWICGDTQAAFIQGTGPEDFVFRNALPFGVFSGVEADLADWGQAGTGIVAASTRGVVLLLAGGQVIETTNAYAPPTGTGHCSLMRNAGGATQLLTCLTYSAEGDKYVPKALTVDYSE
jgi:hypothetical protein